jgi:hypothetical protein
VAGSGLSYLRAVSFEFWVKGELVVQPARTDKQPMGTALALHSPADSLQCGMRAGCLSWMRKDTKISHE